MDKINDNREEEGFVDLQVNGYAGIDFNQDDLTRADLRFACEALARDGVCGVLATIITDDLDRMAHRLQRISSICDRDQLVGQMILGIHVEGPFISPLDGFRGAHPQDAIRPSSIIEMRRLLEAANGLVRMVTLAPECDDHHQVTRMLVDAGVVVAAGHCDPSMDRLRAAIDDGVTVFTHLGNGCPRQIERHDNIVQRALSLSDQLWLCFIADGVHIVFPALANYLRLAGERAIVVSDAMAAAGLGPGTHQLARWTVDVGEDLAAWNGDRTHLVGSAMTMRQAASNLSREVGLSTSVISRLVSTSPRACLKLHIPKQEAVLPIT